MSDKIHTHEGPHEYREADIDVAAFRVVEYASRIGQ